MVKIWIVTVKGYSFGEKEMVTVPRIGETVMIDDSSFKVIDVVHRISTGTEPRIGILLEAQ